MSLRKETKFMRFLKGPVRILARARDFYVRSLTGCAGSSASFGGAVAGPNLQFSDLPRSFSANSSYSAEYNSREQDLRELIRIASTRSLTEKVEAELLRSRGLPAAVPRSRTVTVGRIDEDKPCDFGGDDIVYGRSKSCAPSKSSMVMVV